MKLSWVGAMAAMVLPAVAQAHSHVRFGFSLGFGVSPGYCYRDPGYCYRPSYYAPPPVVYSEPVYVEPAPVYVAPPVVYAPPPVIYERPAVLYDPRVIVRFGSPYRYYHHDTRFYYRR